MPGQSFYGSAGADSALAAILRRDVTKLAGDIGERNLHHPQALAAAAGYLRSELEQAGFTVQSQHFSVQGQNCENLEVLIAGAQAETLVLGAHYDSVVGSPGANDNGSGSAVLLALARALAGSQPKLSLRLVWFVNEEPPYFQTDQMGSLVYARKLKQDQIPLKGMLSLETVGYYSDAPNSQHYPAPFNLFYPSTGNFIGFVANLESRPLLDELLASFRQQARLASEGVASPANISGIGWSDHWAFWQQGYPALMITDTAPFRYPYYHLATDTPDKLDYERMALLTAGLLETLSKLAGH